MPRPTVMKMQDHGRHDRAEHHLEHGHVLEVELRRQLLGVAKAGAFQHKAKGKADQAKDQEHQRLADQCFELKGE